MRALCFPSHLVAAALALAVAAPARAELRISDLDVFLNDHEVNVHVVLLGDLVDAPRFRSDGRGFQTTPAATLDPAAVIYVRVHAETALNGANTFVARMNGTAEQTARQSDYRTIQRVQ